MWLKITILYVLFVEIAIAKEIGEACEPNDKTSRGSCKQVIDCEVAVRAIRLFYKHPFKRCGFKQIMEVVCCPTDEYVLPTKPTMAPATQTTTPLSVKNLGRGEPKRIADRECEKIVNSTVPPVDLHIIGGTKTSNGEFPHMVAIGYNGSEGNDFLCGGSLVSDRFVLTAAHCTKTIKPTFVRLGVIEVTNKEFNEKTDLLIDTIYIHPNYIQGPKYHDLALLKLERRVVYNNNLYPICLYTSTDDPQTPLTVTGWGKTTLIEDILSNTLLKANVTVVSTAECQKAYAPSRQLKNGITELQICAGDPRGLRDTCQGDSGGPLQKLSPTDGYYRLVGVTSFGRGCGSPVPGVYTRVAQYLDWIESVVWPN